MSDQLDEKLAGYRENKVQSVMLGVTDLDGVTRGKYVSLDKFESLMRKGGGFCDCVFGWDANDQLYDPARLGLDPEVQFTGWHTGFPDARYRLLVDSERIIPDSATPYFVGEFVADDDSSHPLCPRSLLNRITTQLEDRGYRVAAGFEYEFFVFNESAHSVRDKNYHNLEPFSPGNFGYSVLRAASNGEEFRGLLDYCSRFRLNLEGLHCETGPGVWEAALERQPLLEASDRAALFKTFSKAYFGRRLNIATFMAKWSMDYPGLGGHFHFSLANKDGSNALRASDAKLSNTGRNALGGLARYLPEWLPMLAPTVNSYTRLVKGAWAPTAFTWGYENRTAAQRVILGGEKSCHYENRIPGADANPYLVAAATLAAAMRGIEEEITPPPPTAGNAYDVENGLPAELKFSPTLRDAATRFGESASAAETFGEKFRDHFTMTRLWEASEAERNVTDWQLKRYFETI